MSDASFDALCDALQSRLSELGIPGAAIAIQHGDVRHAAAFGRTSVEHGLPVTPDTLFQIGSITKTFLGTLVMRLVARGRLSLDTPLQHWVPELALRDAAAARRVTIRHVLTHTAGWVGDWFADHGQGDDAVQRAVADFAQLEQLTPPGAHWSYNNIGFALAALAIERSTGLTFERAMQTEVFDPLGLAHSYFFAGDVITHRFAVGHNVLPDGAQVARPWPLTRTSHPAGGITSTVNELASYAQAFFEPNDAAFLSRDARIEMARAHLPSTGLYRQGLTWWLNSFSDGTPTIEHGGATNGQIAQLTIAPERRFAVAVLTNAGAGRLFTPFAVHHAARAFLGTGLQRTPEDPAARPADPAAYAGRYVARLTELELSVRDGALVLNGRAMGRFPRHDSPPPPPPLDRLPEQTLAFYAPDRFFVAPDDVLGARGEFVRDAQGAIQWVRFGGRLHRRA